MGQLRTRKRGKTWEYSFEGAPVDGKRTTISKGGFRTKEECIKAGTAAKAQYTASGDYFKPSEMSVADYISYWLKAYVDKDLEYNTARNYKQITDSHVLPDFGRYKISSLSTMQIQEWILQKKEKGYSYHTVRDMLSCLSSAMDYAKLACHYIKINPCDDVKMPKFPPDKDRENFNEYVCRGEDFKKLITRFPEGSPFYVPIMTGYCLGTRIGESYGIDLKTDINFEDNTITIERQMQYRQPYWYVQPPKYNSVRTIKMGETFAEIIRRIILERKKNMLKYGEYYIRTYVSPEGKIIELPSSVEAPKDYIERWFINTRECGSLLTPNSFKYCARVAHRELKLPLFHSHCLRHTHGTILAENKVNPKVIMKRLGHKDIATTLQIYVFDTEEMHDNAMEIFDREAI